MKADSFKKWLCDNQINSNEKLVRDCVSRASRVERAFQAVLPDFSFENEYAKDKGAAFTKLISRRGLDIQDPVELPIGTNQMDSITAATKKYFRYLCETKN